MGIKWIVFEAIYKMLEIRALSGIYLIKHPCYIKWYLLYRWAIPFGFYLVPSRLVSTSMNAVRVEILPTSFSSTLP